MKTDRKIKTEYRDYELFRLAGMNLLEQAEKNANDRPDYSLNSDWYDLSCAFYWEDTSEGFKFWNDLYRDIIYEFTQYEKN